MQDRFYKPINMIDYDTLKKLNIWTFPLSIIGMACGIGFSNYYLFYLGLIGEYVDCYLNNKESVYHVKELKELNMLYKEFLNNYHKLNQIFDLTSPLEIMLLYTYLLKNGYLSKGKTHEFSDYNDGKRFLIRYGVFTGKSVCRHDGVLLRDILREENIKSSILLNYNTDCALDYLKLKEIPCLKEKLEALEQTMDMSSEEFKTEVEKIIPDDFDFERLSDDAFHLKEFSKYILNHLITMAQYNGKSYFMDATNDEVLRKRYIDGNLVLTSGFIACIPHTRFINRFYYDEVLDSRLKAKRILKGEDITREEETMLREKINGLSTNNRDIWERFYQENQELYSDISEELERVRSRFIK